MKSNNNSAKPWKILSAVLAAALAAVSCAWVISANKPDSRAVENKEAIRPQSVQAEGSKKRKIIIDTDCAGDDAVALIMAAKDKNTEILGVTVSEGNVSLEQAARNALMVLETAGSDAPVYKGASTTYTGKQRKLFSVFGKDGMGDNDLIHPSRTTQSTGAVDFIIDTVKANPDEVEIVALGPATNLALAMDRDPETMRRVKRYWSMGTAGFGHGNASPVAEFNVYHDAEAYKVFAESEVPITALGFDMVGDAVSFTQEDIDELAKRGGLADFVAKSYSGLMRFNTETRGVQTASIPDGLLMACVLWDNFVLEMQPCHASVITDDTEAYGQVVFYKKGYGYDSGVKFDSYDFNVVTDIADEDFKGYLMELLTE